MKSSLASTALLALTACGRLEFTKLEHDAAVDGDPATPSYRDAVLASGPAVYLRLGELALGLAVDISGNGNDGMYGFSAGGTIGLAETGAVPSDGAVRLIGQAVAGDGSEANVSFPLSAIDWSGDFTVELFVSVHAVATPGVPSLLFLAEEYQTSGFRFGFTSAGELRLWTDESGRTGNVYTTATPIRYDDFMHVALVRAGAQWSMYVDAALVQTTALDYTPSTGAAETGTGALHGVPSDATFDELAVYPRALSASELAAHLAARGL